MQLERKVAIVTGAASGIGRATARLMAKEGASVALADINGTGLQIVADEIKHCPSVPRRIVYDLARDVEIIVSAPVLEYSPLLRDEELLEIISGDTVQGAMRAISRRTRKGPPRL